MTTKLEMLEIELGIDPALGEPASALGDAYMAMGAQLSFTCAPYLLDTAPKAGEQIVVPALLSSNEGLAHRFEDLHELIGTAFYWVVGLHVAAALYHHFVRRDDTLRRMT